MTFQKVLAVLATTVVGAFAIFVAIAFVAAPPKPRIAAAATMSSSPAVADPSLDLYVQLIALRRKMQPALTATDNWAQAISKGSKIGLDRSTFLDLWNLRIEALNLKQRAQADEINPDVREAADATWQELDEFVQGTTDAQTVQLATGDFGKGLGASQTGVLITGLDKVRVHMANFTSANQTALDALNAYAAAYTADHGLAPA